MQLNKLVFAIAALTAGSAFSATLPANIGISSGASASKGNFKLALANRCPAPGALVEYASGSNISTFVCQNGADYATATPVQFVNTANVATGIAEVRLNVSGGSFTALCLLAGWPGGTACPAADTYLDPADNTLKAPPPGSVVLGGLTDVEPNGVAPSVRAGIAAVPPAQVISANFGQTFGIGVTPALYDAMLADQQAAGLIPAACTNAMTGQPECVPSIGKGQMTAIMAASSTNEAHDQGARFLAPSQFGAPATLHYGRRADTSGTQAAAQQFFLGTVCSPASVAVVPAGSSTGDPVGAAMVVHTYGSTGDLRKLLNNATPGFYAVGILSGENAQNEAWRWLRVGGMNMAENATPSATGTNTTTAKSGLYDYWYLSRVVRSATSGVPAAFWTAALQGFGSVPAGTTKGLFAASETVLTRGTSNSCQPVTAN